VRSPWFYYVGKVLVRMLLLLSRWQVKGRENIPSQGPVLIIANHINLADPPVLTVSLGRRLIFMAKQELFHSRILGYLVSSFGAFPVHRRRIDRQALRQASLVLANGLPLAMFPEGRRSHTAQLQSAFLGPALIASHNKGVPILPVGISGTENIKGVGWLLRRPQITVNIGSPFYLPLPDDKPTKAELARLADLMMEHIAELLPARYRGKYDKQGNYKHEN